MGFHSIKAFALGTVFKTGSTLALAAVLPFGAAFAQSANLSFQDDGAAAPVEQAERGDASSLSDIDDLIADGEEEEDELDMLSRSADDPFPDLQSKDKVKPVSVTIRALNKITARYVDIEAPIDTISRFGTLEIVPRFCDKRPPEEFPETSAFLQVYDLGLAEMAAGALSWDDDAQEELVPADEPVALALVKPIEDEGAGDESAAADTPILMAEDPLGDLSEGDKVFSGWMFASSPALNPLEHAVYDVWVIDCKTVSTDSLASQGEETLDGPGPALR